MIKFPTGETEHPEKIGEDAIDFLVSQGVPRQEARENLAILQRHVDPLHPGSTEFTAW